MSEVDMFVNWVDDEAGISVAKSKLGLLFTDCVIRAGTIDRKLSSQNRARSYAVDKDRAALIADAMLDGVPIPKIVVRRVRTGSETYRYVIAGGNHREYAYSQINKMSADIPAHLVECTDSEFEVLCGLLNTVVGEGITRSERLDKAVDAVCRLSMSQKEAARIYGVAPYEVSSHLAFVKFQNRYQISSSVNKSQVQKIREHQRKNGPVADAWGEALNAVKFSALEVAEISRKVDEAGSENDKVDLIKKHVEEKKREVSRTVKRPKYKALKMALGAINKQMKRLAEERVSVARLSNFDVSRDEEKEVRELCKKVAQFLNSL